MSLEEIVDQFIGRTQEIEFFTNWLSTREASPILYIHDALEEKEKKGGIGKTCLLRKYYELARTQQNTIPVFVDFFEVRDRDGVVIAERVVQAVQSRYPDWSCEAFFKLLHEYYEAARGKKTSANLREQLAHALASDFLQLQQQWLDTSTSLLLFFDTFELIESNPITAVLLPTHTFPDNYGSSHVRTIIAGRNELDWHQQNWSGREREITVHKLPPFDYSETNQYFRLYSFVHDSNSVPTQTDRLLYEQSEGRPILIGLITDMLNKRLKEPAQLITLDRSTFEASLVEELYRFDDPSKMAILSMAHIYHRFNAELLHRLMNWPGLEAFVAKTDYEELAKKLSALSFVRRSASGDDFVLHDEMRRLVNSYCWKSLDPQERLRHELSQLAISYYTDLINQEGNQDEKQSYIVERLFHELFFDIERGFQSFTSHFNHAIDFSLRTFARALFQELLKFESLLTHEQRQEIRLSEARVLCKEENFEAALAVLSILSQDTLWAERHRSDLLFEEGICYQELNRYSDAIAKTEVCLEIERSNEDKSRYAMLLNQLGYIHRVQGRYARAIDFYREAIRVQRTLDNHQEYAALLNDMGNALRLQGELEDARNYCKLALHLRRDLFKQDRASEYDIGLSQSTLGHIYHTLGELADEEKAYREAFDIFTRLGAKSAIADSYNNIGRVLIRKGDLKGALEQFKQAQQIAIVFNRRAEIESLNQQGRIALRMEEWEKARAFFEQAIDLARQLKLEFQSAENLLYLAEALDYLNLPSDEQAKEAKRIARNNDYNYLLARAGNIRGDMYFRRQEYQSAFKHYRTACRYMTQRSPVEFRRELRRLNDHLLEVPPRFLPGIIDSLFTYWSELGLNEEFPQLPRNCQEVSRNMLL